MPIFQISLFLYQIKAGKNRVGSKQKRGGERKREADKGSERRSIGEKKKQRQLRNDRLKRYLSSSNQHNK